MNKENDTEKPRYARLIFEISVREDETVESIDEKMDKFLTDLELEFPFSKDEWYHGNNSYFEWKRKIKPCHFCGGDAKLTPVIKHVYKCTKCNAEGETLFRVQEKS